MDVDDVAILRGPGRPRRAGATRSTSTAPRSGFVAQRGRRLRPGARSRCRSSRPGPPLGLGDRRRRARSTCRSRSRSSARATRASSCTPTAASPSARPTRRPASAAWRRFLAGPPRVAAFFADLDPRRGGAVTRAAARRPRRRSCGAACRAAGRSTATRSRPLSCPAAARSTSSSARCRRREARRRRARRAAAREPSARPTSRRRTPRGVAGALVERFSETEQLDLVVDGAAFPRRPTPTSSSSSSSTPRARSTRCRARSPSR